jgi:hypothetical protein
MVEAPTVAAKPVTASNLERRPLGRRFHFKWNLLSKPPATPTTCQCLTIVGYFLIPLVGSITLAFYYLFLTDASFISKVLIAAVLIVSFACRFWLVQYSLAGLFLQVGLCIFILFYRLREKARFSND